MNFLVVDSNSIVNRAFYAIKQLTTKEGLYTNGIYGFLNNFLRLKELCSPDAVAFAFDMKAPTFRHEMYDGYKAKRKGMPDELAQQIPVLKELLMLLGYKVVSCEGWEADDILGTLSLSCGEGDKCFISTGDRDSLQLVRENVDVLLASSKAGKALCLEYNTQKVIDDYGVTPQQLIEIKALMGDSSDNIPGVPGIGQKTAGDLIAKYESIDKIYENLDSLDIKDGVREKLRSGKESAYLSRDLGTIRCNAPIDTDINSYAASPADTKAAAALLGKLEMFTMIERLGLDSPAVPDEKQSLKIEVQNIEANKISELLDGQDKAYFITQFDSGEVEKAVFNINDEIFVCENTGLSFNDEFLKFLSSEKYEKYTYDVKTLYSWANKYGTEIENVKIDTMLAGYILNPSASKYDPLSFAHEHQLETPLHDDEAVSYAFVLPAVCSSAYEEIKENNQEFLLNEVEMPLSKVLANMENIGFLVDRDGIADFGEKLQVRIAALTDEIYSSVGYEFNINSPKQLGEALFVKLQLPTSKKTKSGYSTNAQVLENLADAHPVVPMILEYRTLTKLNSTYCEGLLKVIGSDGRIRSTLNQTETRTGRISSAEPNLQNIPIRSELGREMRKFFVAGDGCQLVDADYSQIELRVLASISNDSEMLNAFNEGLDIHTITASQVFGMPESMVTPLMRSRAKAVNFGIVYGIGAFSLAKDIGVTRKEAGEYIKGYLNHYSGIEQYMKDVVDTAREKGYAQTPLSRRRYLPELSSSNKITQGFGERVALNMPIQGMAADIIKIAMVKVYNRLEKEKMKSRLIMQVHDELIVEAPHTEVEKAAVILKEEMENAVKLNVRLLADVNSGKTWYDAKG